MCIRDRISNDSGCCFLFGRFFLGLRFDVLVSVAPPCDLSRFGVIPAHRTSFSQRGQRAQIHYYIVGGSSQRARKQTLSIFCSLGSLLRLPGLYSRSCLNYIVLYDTSVVVEHDPRVSEQVPRYQV